MKTKFLLFLMLLSGVLSAQDTIRSLVITEVRRQDAFIEITNRGNTPVQLSQFKLGNLSGLWKGGRRIIDLYNDTWLPSSWIFLPEKMLQPGESFVVAHAFDFGPSQYNKKVSGFEGSERPSQIEFYDVADLLLHYDEGGDSLDVDSVTTLINNIPANPNVLLSYDGGFSIFMLEQHFQNGDSAVVDQFGGVFDDDGWNSGYYDVAGVTEATGYAQCIRRYSVKSGNLNFANARGVGLDDSEWMPVPIPEGWDRYRDLWWTVGNDGDYVLDENTLESDVVEVNYESRKITVPWGTRRLDDIMRYMKKKPGLAWNYHLNKNQSDSLYRSARTGDQLTLYACGSELQKITFDIIVSEPAPDVNFVIPIDHKNAEGPVTTRAQNGILAWPRVTRHESGMDTITGHWFGIPFATRTDTLMKYLEKSDDASLEFVFVDGRKRADLRTGDKLKVIAQNGEIKEYFIEVQSYVSSANANLASITWPDIPEFYKGIFGWTGDTIPGFNINTFNYRVSVPADYDGIPAIVAKTEDLNAKIDVKRAVSLSGTSEGRTVSFTVTAEDDSTTNTYNVELIKQKDPINVQPYYAEPFLSEFVYYNNPGNNNFMEICNPGNQPIDMSNYMLFMGWGNNPSSAISQLMENDEKTWLSRYQKYVPGYKWVDLSDWLVNPGILEQDLSVNSFVQPGDVFCLGSIGGDKFVHPEEYGWPVVNQLDVQFNNTEGKNGTYNNPWSQETNTGKNAVGLNRANGWWLFKILNDSIKQGLKPANDPDDFEVIDTWSMTSGQWRVGGRTLGANTGHWRKPEIFKGNPEMEKSFGTNSEDSEWIRFNLGYWSDLGVANTNTRTFMSSNIGQHFFYSPTLYMSTISSAVYKVSEGYSNNENIRGIISGTEVADFLSNLIKADSSQTLMVKSVSDGSTLDMGALLTMSDTLVVLSADSTNTTKYVLDVSEVGLSSDAVLTSNRYDITIGNTSENSISEGVISGFEYGTQLITIVNNVTVPVGATMSVIDNKGAYVPFKQLNYDTSYVYVTVNSEIYFNVLAENGKTRIVYQLQPSASVDDAFILSDLYNVSQAQNLVENVPRGTNAKVLLKNLIPSFGASLILVDKLGNERTEGTIYEDDKIVVTSPNGLSSRVYHLSMLPTSYISSTTYLAYVLSKIYSVDQVNYVISGFGSNSSILITDFYSRITPSMGATAKVVNSDSEEKTEGELSEGDMLKVTSADGKIEVWYEIELNVTSSDRHITQQIEIYPNPTSGKLNIHGLERGNRIQIFNAVGSVIYDLKAQQSYSVLSLDNLSSGIFFIVISNDGNMLGRYKAIKN